ncbi:reverse transcriptase [Plakobranchus ocellatus]|uniref:Reverse transcriptase n=1 Tax=Plakobranchus ocellatus TaxID=259542 RepID=A0AAV3ZSA4_9GAST|nr:reverse transcriptase [Plakobranchus ocellatus]
MHNIPNTVRNSHGSHIESSRRQCRSRQSWWRMFKASMDDTTIICSKEDETRRMLMRLDVLMSWCRMEFKPKKSRSLSIRKRKVDEATTFTVAEQQIPTISQ